MITFHVLLWLDAGDDDDGNDDINGKRNKKLIVEAVAVGVVVLICFECCCDAALALTKLIGLILCLYWINERRMHEDSDWTKDRKKLSEKNRKQKEKERKKNWNWNEQKKRNKNQLVSSRPRITTDAMRAQKK